MARDIAHRTMEQRITALEGLVLDETAKATARPLAERWDAVEAELMEVLGRSEGLDAFAKACTGA
jgi:hypothetical protein